MEKFSDISNRNELAKFLKIPLKNLTYILYVEKPDNLYTVFDIPKRKEGTRRICAPCEKLKNIQKRLLVALYKYQKNISKDNNISTVVSHAFEKKKGIITNAQIHRNKRFVLNIDLADFFDSFHFGRICGYFEKNKYFELPHEVAVIISQLACYNGKLPQGAPTSPVITNLICQILDVKVLKLAKQYKLNYTRYADDMTFSTNDKNFLRHLDGFYERLTKLIQHEGFLINEKKTRLQYKDSKQVVTGLVVNKKINVDRIYYKQTRAMANSLYTSGKYSIDNVEGTIEQLEGRFSFINQIDKYNNKLETGCKHGFRELCSREKQYQKFLFYKYFYVSKKPLIITEGKTDILYLKAALKYYCSEYPELIEKNKDGTFTFKIKFLNRTKRLEYFFGLTMDGADSMKSLYKFFTDSKERGYTNYLKYFNEANSDVNPTPIMLILDNELSNKNKPLSKFLNGIATEEQKETLKERLMIQVIQDSHLFLITNPLVEGSDECEIENLFEDSVRDVELDGKTLSLKDDFDINLHYGKDIFSKYVLKNYQSIDFSNFKLILDNIKKVVISKS